MKIEDYTFQLIKQLELHLQQLQEIQTAFTLKGVELELDGISDSIILIAKAREKISQG